MGDRHTKAAGQIPQDEHFDVADSKKVTDGVLAPGRVVTADISATPILVHKDSLCRIRTTATTYVTFGNPDNAGDPVTAAVTSATTPAIELFGAGVFLVTATADFIRASLAVARLEVLDE
jgi:hypothetical protein